MHEVILVSSKNSLVKLEFGSEFSQRSLCSVVIKCGNYQVLGDLWIKIEELHRFYDSFEALYHSMNGKAVLYHSEMALTLEFAFDLSGKLKVNGRYKEYQGQGNELIFRTVTDHVPMKDTLASFQRLFNSLAQLESSETRLIG